MYVKTIDTPILRPPRLHFMHDFTLSPLNVQKVVAGIRIVAGKSRIAKQVFDLKPRLPNKQISC